MRTLPFMRGLWRSAVVLATAALMSCGGPGGQTSTTTPTETLTLTIDSATLASGTPSVVTAVLKDSNGAVKVGQQITFSTDASIGVISPASGVWLTDSSGTATIQLSPGPNVGSGVITATSTAGTKASLSYSNTVAGAVAESVQLLVSSGNLLADGSSTIDLTALVKDKNNNTVQNAAVTFSSDAGAITVSGGGKTDANGRASAVLSSGGDKSSRNITVTAKIGEKTSSRVIVVAGSKITLSGVGSVVAGTTTKVTIRVQDGAGRAVQDQSVTLASSLGNTFSGGGLSNGTVKTDASGQATVTYTATKSGSDVISAGALNETGTLALNVSNVSFTAAATSGQSGLTIPADGSRPLINLGSPVQIVATYLINGAPAQNKSIRFTTTRGALTSSALIPVDVNGRAAVTIAADTVGEAVITATANDGSSTQYAVEFLSVSPDKIILQPEKGVVGPRGSTSIIAVVKDARNNLVKNQEVNFNVTDNTCGTLSVASGITDSDGRTSTTYTAGNVSGSVENVIVRATLASNTAVSRTTTLTVAGQALFVRIGTGNTVEEPNTTQYVKPYSVIVTDAAGNPVGGATVSLQIESERYYKGFHYWNGTVWQAIGGLSSFTTQTASCGVGAVQLGSDATTTPATLSCVSLLSPTSCSSEDSLTIGGASNGILEAGEDFNNNTKLDPGFVAATSVTSLTSDSTGSGFFGITYPKDRANWVRIKVTAKASVQGTEGSTSASFTLPGLAEDYSDQNVSPPGATSPYGTATSCSNPN